MFGEQGHTGDEPPSGVAAVPGIAPVGDPRDAEMGAGTGADALCESGVDFEAAVISRSQQGICVVLMAPGMSFFSFPPLYVTLVSCHSAMRACDTLCCRNRKTHVSCCQL